MTAQCPTPCFADRGVRALDPRRARRVGHQLARLVWRGASWQADRHGNRARPTGQHDRSSCLRRDRGHRARTAEQHDAISPRVSSRHLASPRTMLPPARRGHLSQTVGQLARLLLFYEFLIYFHFYVLFLKVLLKREIVIKAVLKYFQYMFIMTFFPTF